jgi:excinuclease ABC subunit B
MRELEQEMLAAAEQLDFERAAQLRDRIQELNRKMGQPIPDDEDSDSPGFATKGRRKGKKSGRKRR